MRKSRRHCHSSKNNDIKYSLKIHYGSRIYGCRVIRLRDIKYDIGSKLERLNC